MKRFIRNKLLQMIQRSPSWDDRLRRFVQEIRPDTSIFVEYPLNSRPRYGHGLPAHPKLFEIINARRDHYAERLRNILSFQDDLLRIPLQSSPAQLTEPAWLNGWLPGLDAAALYGFIRYQKPQRYLEVGSGNSTKFARRAIEDQGLQTTILSIDPEPRAEIDTICDRCIRHPLEDVALNLFDQLEADDILFVDCSHRVFMNSDSTVVFLDILPRLKPGVLVEFHDIFLPDDYPPDWAERFYAEAYLLAAYLLARGDTFEIMLPNYFIATDAELSGISASLWKLLTPPGAQVSDTQQGFLRTGGSFWIRMLPGTDV